MKCVKSTISDDVIRVSNERAVILVENSGTWNYINKQAWKESGRKYGKG